MATTAVAATTVGAISTNASLTTVDANDASQVPGTTNSTPPPFFEGDPPMATEVWLVPLIFGIICLIGIIGNGLVIYVIVKNKQMRTVTNYYILNLAITDLAFLTCAVPFSATNHVAEWFFGEFMCKFTFYLIQVTLQATCITLTAMSADRYYAIAHPLKSLKTRTPRVAASISAGIWICSALIAIPIAYYRDIAYLEWYGIRPFCVERWPSASWVVGWYSYTFVAAYALPVVIITACYTMMLRRLWNQVVPGEASSLHAQSLKQKKKITRMVMVVVMLFFVCWLPIHVMAIGPSVAPHKFDLNNDAVFIVHLFANCLSYSNSCMNPFIYAFMGENFRKCFKKVFPKCFKKHSSTVATVDQGDDIAGAGTDGTRSTAATLMRQKVESGSAMPSQA